MYERQATFLIIFIKNENTEKVWTVTMNTSSQQGGVFINASDQPLEQSTILISSGPDYTRVCEIPLSQTHTKLTTTGKGVLC